MASIIRQCNVKRHKLHSPIAYGELTDWRHRFIYAQLVENSSYYFTVMSAGQYKLYFGNPVKANGL